MLVEVDIVTLLQLVVVVAAADVEALRRALVLLLVMSVGCNGGCKLAENFETDQVSEVGKSQSVWMRSRAVANEAKRHRLVIVVIKAACGAHVSSRAMVVLGVAIGNISKGRREQAIAWWLRKHDGYGMAAVSSLYYLSSVFVAS